MAADVIIIGAGIIGLSTAFQIARRSSLRVLVLEKGAGLGEGSTGASSAICRHRYSLDDMVRLASDSVRCYRNWSGFLGRDDTLSRYEQCGVLWMPGQDSAWSVREHERLTALGIATELLDDDELAKRFPAISRCVLAPDTETGVEHDCQGGGAQLLETEAGFMDPVNAAQDLAAAAREQGVSLRLNTQVRSVDSNGGRVSGVTLADGEQLTAPVVINAAGPWCNALSRELGIAAHWDLVPTRIQVLYLDRPPELAGDIPATLDMQSGVYFRLQNRGQQLVVGSAREEDEREVVQDPDDFERLPDDEFQQRLLHLLHHRLPALPYRGKVRGYCGLYTVNRQDAHPVVGETELGGYYLANGFTGHGFKLAPAVGGLLAAAITGDRLAGDTTVPIELLAPGRTPIPMDGISVLA